MAHPADGYFSLWPFRYYGDDVVYAAIKSKTTFEQKAFGFAAATVHGVERLSARDINTARKTVMHLDTEVHLFRAVAGNLWQRVEILSNDCGCGDPVDKASGALIEKGYPSDELDAKKVSRWLSGSLRHHAREAGQKAVNRFLDNLDLDYKKMSGRQLDKALNRAAKHLQIMVGDQFTKRWSAQITVAVKDAMRKTKTAMKNGFLPSVQTALRKPEHRAADGIGTMHGFFVRDRFGKVNSAMTLQAKRIVNEGLRAGLGNAEIARSLRTGIKNLYEMRSAQYAEVVSNVAVQRARSGAQLFAYVDAGVEIIQVEAVLDERTTEQCRLMDGQILSVRDCKEVMARGMRVKNPEDIARVNPFMDVRRDKSDNRRYIKTRNGERVGEIIRGGRGTKNNRGTMKQMMGGKGFKAAGIGMPPYHFRCRTYTVPRFEFSQVPAGRHGRAFGPSSWGKVDPTRPNSPVPVRFGPEPTVLMPYETGAINPVNSSVFPSMVDREALARAAEQGVVSGQYHNRTGNQWETVRYKEALSDNWERDLADRRVYVPKTYSGITEIASVRAPEEIAASLLVNPHAAGRDIVVRHVNRKAKETWMRINTADKTGLRAVEKKYRAAIDELDRALRASERSAKALARAKANERKAKAKAKAARKRAQDEKRTAMAEEKKARAAGCKLQKTVVEKDEPEVCAVARRARERADRANNKAEQSSKKAKDASDKSAKEDLRNQKNIERKKAARKRLGVSQLFLVRQAMKKGVFGLKSNLEGLTAGEEKRVATSVVAGRVGKVPTAMTATPKPQPNIGQAVASVVKAAGSLEKAAVRNDVYSARPDPVDMIYLARKPDDIAMSVARVGADGRVVKRGRWRSVPWGRIARQRGETNLVNLYSHIRIEERHEAFLGIVRGIERRAGTKYCDWILTDAAGDAFCVRVENGKIAKTSRSARGFYRRAVVDWRQPNFISGVSTEEQCEKRIIAMEDDINEAMDEARAKAGGTLTRKKLAGVILGMLEKTGRGSIGIASKLNIAERKKSATHASAKEARELIRVATKHWGLGCARALQAHPLPAIELQSGRWVHSYYEVAGETSTMVMPRRPAPEIVAHLFAQHLSRITVKASVAARITRNENTADGSVMSILGRDYSLFDPNGYYHSFRLYGEDIERVKPHIGKPRTAEQWRDILHVDESHGYVPSDYLADGISRLVRGNTDDIGDLWANYPRQVALALCVLRGHFSVF